MLKLPSPEPAWIDKLPGVRMQVRPLTALDALPSLQPKPPGETAPC